MTVRIVVADDHAVVREGLRALLAAVPGYELAGTAATAPEAVRAAVTLHPNVLVLDIQMPGPNGIDAARERRRCVRSPVSSQRNMYGDLATLVVGAGVAGAAEFGGAFPHHWL